MKTSLVIEDSLFEAAKKEAEKEHKTISQVISAWAAEGRKSLRDKRKVKTKLAF